MVSLITSIQTYFYTGVIIISALCRSALYVRYSRKQEAYNACLQVYSLLSSCSVLVSNRYREHTENNSSRNTRKPKRRTSNSGLCSLTLVIFIFRQFVHMFLSSNTIPRMTCNVTGDTDRHCEIFRRAHLRMYVCVCVCVWS